MSNIVILVGSMRKNGNTDLLAQAFAEGARENNFVEIVSVADYKVNPCIGCNSCFTREGNKCFQNDDMDGIYEKLKVADMVVVASPVYFYGISAELKAVIDRLHTPMRNEFSIKKLALLLVGAAELPELFDAIKLQYQLVLKFRAFVRLCSKAGLLSHESVVIDGSKFRAVNADNKSYVSSNAKKVLLDVEEKTSRYMKELDEADAAESRPGALTKEDIAGVLDYLERRKAQLTEALEQMAGSGENHICTTDPESRLMKTRDGIRPSFNVQTAVEPKNHLIVHYDVTSECTDWHLFGDGINASKAALGVENLEGIADRGYSNDEEILQCLLNGDTPTTHPNKGEKSRMFRFQKTDTKVTGEMLFSKDKDTILQCISAGELPEILHRGDVELEVVKRREQGSSLYLDKETGEVVSYAEMKAQGGLEKAPVEVRREPPLHPYFERDIEKDIVICPMGQTLFYAGPGHPNGKKDPCIRRYHRLSACLKCPNKCTLHKRRIVSFKEGETRKEEAFYEKARENRIVRKTSRRFKVITLSEEESSWDEWVILRFYPNRQHLRKRNTVVEHPYGTVKRWHGAGYLLTKGKQKAAAEMGLSFLAYNFRRVVNLLGVNGLMEMILT